MKRKVNEKTSAIRDLNRALRNLDRAMDDTAYAAGACLYFSPARQDLRQALIKQKKSMKATYDSIAKMIESIRSEL